MTLEQAIEVIRKLFNAQGIDALTREELDALTIAIRSLEAWQKVREDIDGLGWHGDMAFWNGVDACKAIIDKALGEVEQH